MLRISDPVGDRGLARLWTSEHLSVQSSGQTQEQTRPDLGFIGWAWVWKGLNGLIA